MKFISLKDGLLTWSFIVGCLIAFVLAVLGIVLQKTDASFKWLAVSAIVITVINIIIALRMSNSLKLPLTILVTILQIVWIGIVGIEII